MPDAAPQYYAVCIGINQYPLQSGLGPLRYAEADAMAMDALFAAWGLPPEKRCLLKGELATLEAINTALEEFILNCPGEEDVVIFYFAGHSVPLRWEKAEASEVFLAPYDFDETRVLQNRAFRQRQALSMSRLRNEFFSGEGVRRRLFLFDSCYSGDFFGRAYRDATTPLQGYVREVFASTSSGRVALSSCLPTQAARELEQLQHGLFTYHVLEALSGRATEARRADGWVTVNTLYEYLAGCLPQEQRPVLSGVQHDTFELVRYAPLESKIVSAAAEEVQAAQRAERLQRLRTLLADHSSFLNNRLESFVGRATELTQIQARIQGLLSTGGYVTITGQAGQGKSSIIAKLVALRGVEETAFHFIPLNPGPEHQIGLLRNLLARLILKYQLSELYVASESRAALREAFFAVLREISEQGGQEVLFVDGLDQLEEEHNGERDLSFFPTNPPVGMVLVLGTRPNDTLRPLELLTQHYEYPLPDLSRNDFKLILQHRQVTLNENLVDRFYAAMEQNALYLDLVAKELYQLKGQSLEVVIANLTDDPKNLFSLATDRFKRQWQLWKEIVKPVLGVLLVAQEPLSKRQIRDILNVDADDLNRGVELIGGFVIDEQQRYSLYHLKFREFLTEDPAKPRKKYIFAQDEVERWQQRLAQWSEGPELMEVWQECPHDLIEQQRRLYARRHVLTHLYHARQWQRLCAILDAGDFGRAKIQWDPSMRSYALDLAWGEQAESWQGYSLEQGINRLALLWRYSLLRCHLASRADSYPDDAFEAMILLGQTVKAVGIAELLTTPKRKVRILSLMASVLSQLDGRQQEAAQLVKRAQVVASLMEHPVDKVVGLTQTSKSALAQATEQKVESVTAVENEEKRAEDVLAVVKSLVQQQRWQEVEQIITGIESEGRRARALCILAVSLFGAGKHEQAQQAWQEAERTITAIENEERRAALWGTFIESLAQGQQWQKVERLIPTIENDGRRARVLSTFAVSLFGAGKHEQAQQAWQEAERIATTIENNDRRVETLNTLVRSFMQAHQWQEAERIVTTIENGGQRARVLSTLAENMLAAGKTAQAQQAWQEAERLVSNGEKDDKRTTAWSAFVESLTRGQQWQEAEQFIATLGNDSRRASALTTLAEGLFAAGEHKMAQQAWREAERLISAIENEDKRAETLNALVRSFMQAQQWQEAERIVATIPGNVRQVEGLTSVAEGLAQAGQQEEAQRVWREVEQFITSFENASKRSASLRVLVRSLTHMQQWQEVERLAAKLENDDRRASTLSVLAKSLAQRQQWQEANRIIATIEKEDRRAEALSALAKSLVQADKYEQAQQAWQEAERTIATIWDRNDHDEILNAFAACLLQTQQWQETEQAITTMQGRYTRVKAFAALAERLVQVGKHEQAQQAWQAAERIVAGIEDEQKRAEALKTLLRSLVQRQQWQEAERIIAGIKNTYRQSEALHIFVEGLLHIHHWQEAERVILTIKNTTVQASAWSALVESLAQGGQWQEAERIIATAPIWNNYWKATAWSALAKGHAQAGNLGQAQPAWRKAERIISNMGGGYIQNRDRRVAALSVLAESLAQGGQYQEAERVIANFSEPDKRSEALNTLLKSLIQGSERLIVQQAWQEVERTITYMRDTYWQARTWSSVAAKQAEAGKYQQAQRGWQEAERLIDTFESDDRRAVALSALAESLAQGKQWQEAERLIGSIREPYWKVKALSRVAHIQEQVGEHGLAQQAWQEAERTIATRTDRDRPAPALKVLIESLVQSHKHEQALRVVQHAWKSTRTEREAFALLPLAFSFLDTTPTLGKPLLNAMEWVDTFLHS